MLVCTGTVCRESSYIYIYILYGTVLVVQQVYGIDALCGTRMPVFDDGE